MQSKSDFPYFLSAPAQRTLAHAGITNLKQVAEYSEADLLQLHGFGPKSITMLRPVLAKHGLTFATSKKSPR